MRPALLPLVLTLAVTHPAPAQMGYTANSLEWLMADADTVVHARVESVVRAPLPPTGDGSIPGESRVRKRITLRVLETLKGDPSPHLTFTDETLAANHIPEAWQQSGSAHLWFLTRSHKPEKTKPENPGTLHPYGLGWTTIRLAPPVDAEKGFRPIPDRLFTLDLDVLDTPPAILQAARATARAGAPQKLRAHAIFLPPTLMQRSGSSGDANLLIVPIDTRLESLAKRLIQHPDTFLTPPESPYRDSLRLEGLKALRHFPSPRNTRLLQSLEDDPASSIHIAPDGTQTRVHDIRDTALEILRQWQAKRPSEY